MILLKKLKKVQAKKCCFFRRKVPIDLEDELNERLLQDDIDTFMDTAEVSGVNILKILHNC